VWFTELKYVYWRRFALKPQRWALLSIAIFG
jgi:hypothetical protein